MKYLIGALISLWIYIAMTSLGTVKTGYNLECNMHDRHDFCEMTHKDGFKMSFIRAAK